MTGVVVVIWFGKGTGWVDSGKGGGGGGTGGGGLEACLKGWAESVVEACLEVLFDLDFEG